MWKKKYYRHPSALKGGIEEENEGKKRKNKKKGGGRSDCHATAIERTHTPHTQHTSTTKNDIGRKKKKKEGRGGGGERRRMDAPRQKRKMHAPRPRTHLRRTNAMEEEPRTSHPSGPPPPCSVTASRDQPVEARPAP